MSIGGAPRNIPHNVKELGGNAREREHIGQKSSNIHLHFSSPEFETLFQQGTIVYRQGITRSKSDERSIHSDDSEECESYQIPVQLKDLEGRSWELSAVVDTGADRSFISRTALSEIGRLKESPIPQDKQKTFTSLFGNAITPKSFIHVKLSSDAIYLDQSVKLKVIEDTEEFQIILGRDFIARYRNSTGQSLLTQVGDLMADKKESRNKARQLGGSKEFNNVSHDSRKTAQVTEALSEKKIDAEIFSTGFGPGEEDSDGEQFGSSILSQRPSPNAVNHDTVNSNRVEASSVEAIMTPAKAQRLNESLAGDDRNEYSSSDESQNSSSGPPSVIFSDVTAPSSSTSQLSTEESVAARELVALLLEDRMLETLFLAALKDPKIGPERFQRNFRILLKVYSRNLREEAQNSLHREAARLVLSRARYTANSIRMILGPEDEKGKELNWWVMSQRSRQQGLGKAIRAWKDRSALSGTEDQDDTKNSDDEIPELDSDSDNESSNLQSLAEDIKEFMISGNAFRNLQRNFSEFVHPPRTYRSADDKHKTSGKTNDHIPLGEEELEVQEICAENVVSRDDTGSAPNPDYLSLSHPTILIDHRRAIRFTPWTLVPRPRIVDQAKRRVEVFLRCPIIWWPLKPYKTVCPNDCIRMDWTCVSATIWRCFLD